jgi:hypothetical protein
MPIIVVNALPSMSQDKLVITQRLLETGPAALIQQYSGFNSGECSFAIFNVSAKGSAKLVNVAEGKTVSKIRVNFPFL